MLAIASVAATNDDLLAESPYRVMAGLVPAIHVLLVSAKRKDVDARHKAGHDGSWFSPMGNNFRQSPYLVAAGRNLNAATIVSTTKISRATPCAIANGGSDCVGASALSAGIFKNACTMPTKVLR